MLRIVFFEVAPYEREALAAAGFTEADVQLVPVPLNAQTAHLAAAADVVSVFVYSRIDAEVLAALK